MKGRNGLSTKELADSDTLTSMILEEDLEATGGYHATRKGYTLCERSVLIMTGGRTLAVHPTIGSSALVVWDTAASVQYRSGSANTSGIIADRELRELYVVERPERNRFVMDVDSLRRSIQAIIGAVPEVGAVYILPEDDGFTVYTHLQTPDRVVRRQLFSLQLQIHELFPNIELDFRVSFAPEAPSPDDFPSDAILCVFR